jgi:hypothetical protein
MTLRLRLSHPEPGWTELFRAGPALRPMRVMADAEALHGRSDPVAGDLLAGLLSDEDIHVWRYSDDGPPPATRCVRTASGQPVAAGWVVAAAAPPGGQTTHTLAWAVGPYGYQVDLVGEPVLAASTDKRARAYEQLGPDQAAARRVADAVAACAARQIKADLYVTEREYLHQLTRPIGRGVTFCTPRQALALVGLYLRSQGRFLLWKDPADRVPHSFDKGLYYWVGARELLPAGWRWYTACVQRDANQDQAAGGRDLTYLGGAVFQRVTRVLQARDDLLRAMNCWQDNNVAEDALTALDTCLMFLMGAMDAAARVAHRVLGLPAGREHDAGWQRDGWLAKVADREPSLAALVAAGTAGADVMTILSKLRNTVHGAGLPALATIGLSGGREGTLVGLPSADRGEILAAVGRLGGPDAWGLQELLPERVHADPGVLLGRLLPSVITLLNGLMTATPVERLRGVSLKAADMVAPRDRGGVFGERERQSIRWQLGLDEGALHGS